jgi:hypothetical protein
MQFQKYDLFFMLIVYVMNLLLLFVILLLIVIIYLVNMKFVIVRLWIDGLTFMNYMLFLLIVVMLLVFNNLGKKT